VIAMLQAVMVVAFGVDDLHFAFGNSKQWLF
jgi:hypothetical protein